MNDTELEIRLREQLPRLADFAVDEHAPGEPIARVTSIDPPRRSRRKVAALVAAAAVVIVAVAVAALVPRDSGRELGSGGTPPDTSVVSAPAGPAVHTLTIVASNFHYDAVHYVVPAGVTELRLVSSEGTHTLQFDQPQFAYVHLAVPGGPSSVKVDFVAGHTYAVFCSLPGHQKAGEVATISVASDGTDVEATTTTTSIRTGP